MFTSTAYHVLVFGLRALRFVAPDRVVWAFTVLWLGGCAASPSPPAGADEDQALDGLRGVEWFVDQAEPAGLTFTHFNGMSGAYYQPEIMGPGVGMCDYDNDGDLDVVLTQGAVLEFDSPQIARSDTHALTDRLYRNDLAVRPDGTRDLRFTDVTDSSGLTGVGYGMGVACGDFDNDGWVDIYLTRFGPNQLFRNQHDGTFLDVSAVTGTDDPSWGVSAAFFDFDRDGWLDLFVGNYLNYSVDSHVVCFDRAGPPDYCPPEVTPAAPSRLYRNQGDGTFLDVTRVAGLGREFGPALGVSTADFDNDGWLDFFVANDQQENQLWLNDHDGTFSNVALLSGVALGAAGEAKADMGVDAGDFDNDGDADLFVTELTSQGSTLYVNDGHGLFEDRSARVGIRGPSLPFTGFGAAWFDFDNDGWLDVMAVNGSVTRDNDKLSPDNPFPLQQRNQLFRNRGTGQFDDLTDLAGAALRLSEVSRGAAFGDIDNDGDTDVLIGNDAGPVRLLINNVGNRRQWVGLRLTSDRTQRDLVGARVAVVLSDGSTLWRRARADGSYASSNDPRVLVGLGDIDATSLPSVRVTWPTGETEAWSDVPTGRYTTLTQGGGDMVAPP